jgi:hypothetical protein
MTDAPTRKTHPAEYAAWTDMHARCSDPSHPRYADEGGRGISVCDRWTGPDRFANFLEDVGPMPDAPTPQPEGAPHVTTFRNKNGMRVSEEFFSVEVAEDGTWFRAYDDGRGEVAYQEWLEMIEQAGRTVGPPTLKAYLAAAPAERKSRVIDA